MRRFGGILICMGHIIAVFCLVSYVLHYTRNQNFDAIHDQINDVMWLCISCLVILYGVVVICTTTKVSKNTDKIKNHQSLKELEVTSLLSETLSGELVLNEESMLELALQYKEECPKRTTEEIISLKSLEISGILQLLPSPIKFEFEPTLKQKLRSLENL